MTRSTTLTGTARRTTDTDALAPAYKRPQVVFERGRGVWLEARDGRTFLDMTSGIAVNALGHAAPEVVETLREHADGLVHVSNLYHTQPAIDLARELTARSFAHQVFFCNSGAEAVEGAIKFARKASGPERRDVVYFEGSFHGRTFGALAATDRPDYKAPFEPLPGGFRRAPWNDAGGLDAIDERTAAVVLEPIQGESGIRVPDPDWVRAVRARCDATGAALIFDEIQCGLGRTGTLFAHQELDVRPDAMTLAKPLAGGLPMGAVLLGERLASAVEPGCHGTTFGGGPLVARVALRVLATIAAEAFLADVRRKGQELRRALAGVDEAFEVRGRGLMVGVRVPDPGRLHELAFAEGLLIVPAGNSTLRFLPALNATDEELCEAVDRFRRAAERAESEVGS